MCTFLARNPLVAHPPQTADDVQTFIRRHTSLRAETVQPLGAGMASVAWRVDGAWVARFPVTADARAGLERELSLLALLDDALPVPVPRVEHVVRRDGEPEMTAYRFLAGEPLSLAAVAARIGDEAVMRVEALWRAHETATDDGRLPPDTLAHADLKPEHVLHDPTSGQITAVLDWGDAGLSHPAFDLAIVGLFFDASVRDEVARRLPDVDGQQVARDAELLVAVRWLCDLELGAADGDEPFQDMCAAELRADLQVALRRED